MYSITGWADEQVQMVESHKNPIATREFQTDDGLLTLQIFTVDDETPAFEYQFIDVNEEVRETATTYGADTLQALLFCITAAGDYLQNFVPSASFADLGVTGLLSTDLSKPNEWRAQVHLPAVQPE